MGIPGDCARGFLRDPRAIPQKMGSVETTGKTMRAAVTASFLVMCAIVLLTIAPNSRHSALGSELKSEKAIDSLDLSRSFRSALRANENGFFRRSHVTKGATGCVGGGCFGSKPAVVLEKPFEVRTARIPTMSRHTPPLSSSWAEYCGEILFFDVLF
eukprot:1357173-Amorphochlora_amoeboformis.AAC.1